MELERHTRFYFDDGNLVFRVCSLYTTCCCADQDGSRRQVEGTLFNVHRYFFQRDSAVFRDMFSIPSAIEGDGASEKNPITLEGVKSADFASFLSCLYPL